MSTQTLTAQGKTLVANGINYTIVTYPLSQTAEIQDINGVTIYTVSEDETGEYLYFHDHEDNFLLTSPHIGNFSGVENCIEWFLGTL